MAEYPGPIAFAHFASAPHPLVAGFAAGSNDRPAVGQKPCPKTWGIERITLECGAQRSTSYAARDHADIAAGRAAGGRFYFAPIADTVTIKLALKNPGNAETVKLELFRSGSAVPVWQRTLSADQARAFAGGEAWDGSFATGTWTAAAQFPHQMVTVEHSPYMLKATAIGSPEDGFVERWTYLDILVDKIEVQWGGVARIPPAARDDVDANFRVDTTADERALVTTLATQRLGDAIDPTLRHEVELPSNQFATDPDEMIDDALFLRHKQQWGDGPRIPLVAKIWVLRADGSGEHGGATAKALGKAQFMWDWESEDEINNLVALYPKAVVRRFLRDSLEYKRADGTAPTGSTNCHVDHGGKRGGAATVFAAMPPFTPVRGATRVWASLTRATLAGADAGYTGVMFRPSRMARDTYKVSVYLASVKAPGGVPELDTAATADDVRRDNVGLPRAATGVFEVQRVIRARYVRKAPAVVAADIAASTTEYARAGLMLAWVPGLAEEQRFQNNFNTYVARIINNTLVGDRDNDSAALTRRTADCFAGIDQFTGGGPAGTEWAFTAHSWDVFHRTQKAAAIRRYVCDKQRKIDTPKKKYDKWRLAHPLPADDTGWLDTFYNGLSAKRRAKIDAELQGVLNVRTMYSRDAYITRLGTATLHGFKAAAGEYLSETPESGFVCFHCCDSVRFRNHDGTYVEQPTGVGGLAPSGSCTRDGKRTFNLMFLYENVPADRIGVPNVYDVSVSPIIKHEIGHNFYLPHAPSLPGKREAGGFKTERHDHADLLCLMNYDTDSDHLCGLCNLRLRGWAASAASGPGLVDLANVAATNRVP